jgi:hypothetical protein
VADLFASLRNVFGQRPVGAVDARGERDLVGDVAPFVAAAIVAWWTTVRPAAFGVAATWWTRTPGILALVGGGIVAMEIARGTRRLVATILVAWVAPCALTWVLGRGNATALSEPIEVFVGAIAWTAIGIVLMRPQAVAAPKGASGGRGPTIGASDDVARVAMREVEAEMMPGEPPPKLRPRHPMPRLASLALIVAGVLASVVGLSLARVGTNEQERAILARLAAAAGAIVLLSTAGDLVEVRYLNRAVPKPRKRLSRAVVSLAILALLVFIGFVLINRGD